MSTDGVLTDPTAGLPLVEVAVLNTPVWHGEQERRDACEVAHHPAMTWSPFVGQTFCPCGSHRYLGQIDSTLAIRRSQLWEPIRLASLS